MHTQSAIVLIEFQKQWTAKGLYNTLIRRQLRSRHVIENTIQLVNQARQAGLAIIHAPLIIDPEHKKGWLSYITFGKFFTKNTPKAALTPGTFREGDIVVKGRYAFDAFIGSDLEKLLHEQSIKTIYLGGFITDQCIAKTFNTAQQKGFRPIVLSDCTATVTMFLQRRAEARFKGALTTSMQLVKEL